MKANLKGLSGIKGLLLQHGEKLGIAVAGLLALWLIYLSLGQTPLSDQYEPADLQQKIQQTRATVEQSTWDKAVAEHPDQVRVTEPVAKEMSGGSVPADPYKTSDSGWDRAVITPTISRTDPILMPAVEVTATGGYGLFAFMDEAIRRQRALDVEAEAARKQQEMEKQREQGQRNQLQGRNPGGGERGLGPGGGPGMPVDPDHPNRRPVESNMTRPTGLPLQGDERVDLTTWACVTAKVPIKEQISRFKDAFENARGGYSPDVDFPQYAGYFVERAEVTPGEPQWQKIPVHDAQAKRTVVGSALTGKTLEKLFALIQKEWPGQSMEVVDGRYMDPSGVLIYPLPPLVGREWGIEATHPDIPLAVNAPPMETEMQPEGEQPAVPAANTDEADEFRPTDVTGGVGGRPGAMRGGFGGAETGMMGGFSMGGGGGFGMGRGRSEGGGLMGSRGGGMGTLSRGVTHWLLRFFDFTVEPGKQYKYRVRLVMSDPNRRPFPPNALDPAVMNRIRDENQAAKKAGRASAQPIRFTEWSEPSPTVGIPLAGGVQVAEAKSPTGKLFNDEPTAKLLVDSIGDVEGKPTQAAIEKEFHRGGVADLVSDVEVLTIDGRWIDEVKSFGFRTGITVLDVKGGEQLSRDHKTPARVLLMDPAGQLFVRNELDDLPAVERHRLTFQEPDRRNRNAPAGGGYPEGGEGGRGMEMGDGGMEMGFGGRGGR